MRILLLVAVLLSLSLLAPDVADAQQAARNTLGKVFNGFDGWRERQRWLPAWLDDKDWKTWCWHGAITVAGGYGISLVTPLSPRGGRMVFAAFYVARELYNVYDRRRLGMPLKPLDHFMDAGVPVTLAAIHF